MKVRFAAVFATVLLAASFGAWLWFDREPPTRGSSPSDGKNPSETIAIDVAVSRSPDSGAAVRSDSTTGASRTPSLVAPTACPPGDPPSTSASERNSLPSVPTTSPASQPSAIAPPATPDPEQSEKAAIDVDQVGLMLRDYRTRMGENPFGTNAEIMKAVMGENPKQARLGPPEGQKLNAAGELVDRWGTPYFFHQLSKASMEIRSAGPDKVMWTEDDVIQR